MQGHHLLRLQGWAYGFFHFAPMSEVGTIFEKRGRSSPAQSLRHSNGILNPWLSFITYDAPPSSVLFLSSSPAAVACRKYGKGPVRKCSGLKPLRYFHPWRANTTMHVRTFKRSCLVP